MASLKEYFEKRDANKPKPKWVYGDRIFGYVGKVPVLGMVIREDYEDPKQVLCHLDLPIMDGGVYKWVLYVPAKGMKRLKLFYGD
jgi:hypothetical protein